MPLPRRGVLIIQLAQGRWVIDYGDELDVAQLDSEAAGREYAEKLGVELVGVRRL